MERFKFLVLEYYSSNVLALQFMGINLPVTINKRNNKQHSTAKQQQTSTTTLLNIHEDLKKKRKKSEILRK